MSEIQGLPPLPKCFNGVIGNGEKIMNGVDHDLKMSDPDASKNHHSASANSQSDSSNNSSPFSRLNEALNRLKNEMVKSMSSKMIFPRTRIQTIVLLFFVC